ncbi:Outer membrane efflux protein [hydrothermal vent metagenome]|uniref:Outer membrane efflux protein n=1 Tax=hydrothermal vent metagenome TaxID=652676 RepID=A0A1W1EFJ7_9ZZZZ
MKFIVFVLFSTTLFAQISIQDAWNNVQNRNDGLKASHADVLHAKLKKESAEGMYMPSVSITGSYTHLDDSIGADISGLSNIVNNLPLPIPIHLPSKIDFLDQDIVMANLNVLYPLYMGGKIDAAQDAYMGKLAEAKAKQRLSEDKAFLELVKVYYGVIVTKSLLKTRQESQRALQIHYAHARKLKLQGQISKAELLNAQVKLDIAKIETTKAEHKVDIVVSAFKKMIKSNNTPKSSLFVAGKLGSKYRYSDKSINNYASIDLLDAKSKQADAMIDVEKAAWQPEVISYATVNLHKGDSMLEEGLPEWMVGVGFKFDIFSRKDRAKEVEAAKVMRAKVSSLKEQAKSDLKLAVQKTYNEILLYRDEFNSLSSSLALANENYRLRSLAFKEGLSTSVEVVDAQMLLSGAKTKRLNAAYNYVKKLAELSVLTGDKTLFFKFEQSSKRIK